LNESQRHRVDLAFDRSAWVADVRAALRAKDRQRIDRLFDVMPEGGEDRLTEREHVRLIRLREQDTAVQSLRTALSGSSDAEKVAALQSVERLGAWLPESMSWTEVSGAIERHTLKDAVYRAATQTPRDYPRLARLLPQLKAAFAGRFPSSADGIDYDNLDLEVKQVSQVSRLREALETNDDRKIVAAAFPDLYKIIPKLDRTEQARIERAVAAANRALRRSGQRESIISASSETVETR
jgi:hypothetical protein